MIIFVNGKGFFESMGRNGITFTDDIDKAFQCVNKNCAKVICKSLNADSYTILKIV